MKNKKLFHFTLIIGNVDGDTPHLEDSLFDAGCDDALINCREGTIYLDFDRHAESLEEAVMSAICDVESASIKPKVVSVAPENLVTVSDVAGRLNVKRQAVSLWTKRQRRVSAPFPKPVMKLSDKSPLWKWREILEWLSKNKMLENDELIHEARFLENISVALEERGNKELQKYRKALRQVLENIN